MSALSPLGYSSESCGYCKDASSGKRRPNSRTWILFLTSPLQLHPVTRASAYLCAVSQADSSSIDCRARVISHAVVLEVSMRLLAFTCVPLTVHSGRLPRHVHPPSFFSDVIFGPRGRSRVRPQLWVCMLLDVISFRGCLLKTANLTLWRGSPEKRPALYIH
jgi:hypothetical protein